MRCVEFDLEGFLRLAGRSSFGWGISVFAVRILDTSPGD